MWGLCVLFTSCKPHTTHVFVCPQVASDWAVVLQRYATDFTEQEVRLRQSVNTQVHS
jgi:hypothetical protein